VAKEDDSSLDPEQLRAVHIAARRALDRACAWGVHPTPVGVILEAGKLRVAPASAFDPRQIMSYLIGKAEGAIVERCITILGGPRGSSMAGSALRQ
jgi:hypothetical protein